MPALERYEQLIDLAIQEVDGPDANQVLWDRRVALTEEHGQAIGYELVIPIDRTPPWETFVEMELVKLTDHLLAKNEPPLGSPYVTVAVWRATQMFIYTAPGFWEAIAQLQACTVDALLDRVQAARTRRDTEQPESIETLALPGPKSPKNGSPDNGADGSLN